MKNLYLYVSFFILIGCAMNKTYLKPVKINSSFIEKLAASDSSDIKKFTIKTKTDTLNVGLDFSKNFTPTFFTKNGNPVALNYDIQSVFFNSENGNKLNGWWLKPKNHKINATIIQFHGNGSTLLGEYRLMAPLAEEGFEIFMFDYSGFGLSEGKATRKNLLKDAKAALNYVLIHKTNQHLIIYGQSLGGHLATVTASENQDKIDGLITEGAFSSYKEIAKFYAGFFGKMIVKKEYSAFEAMGKIHKPVLIIHSREDKIVPFEMGQQLYSQANEPKAFLPIKGAHLEGTILYKDSIINEIKSLFLFGS